MAAYVDYKFFKSIYGGDAIPKASFERFSWEAQKRVDDITFEKLKFAFPANADDVEAIKRCVCALTQFLYQIDRYQKSVMEGVGVITQADGTVKGKMITSVTSGSESVSYSAGSSSVNSEIVEAAKNKKVADAIIYSKAQDYLAGVADANGVNLLYAGY